MNSVSDNMSIKKTAKLNKESFEEIIHNKKIAVFGKYRYCNDFKYVYEDIFGKYFDNMFYTEDANGVKKNELYDIKNFSNDYETVIACLDECDYKSVKELNLENVIWMEDLFDILDDITLGWYDTENPSDEEHRIPENKKLALWGASQICDFFIKRQTNLKPDCIIDSDINKKGTFFNGIPIVSPDDIKDYSQYYIIIMCREIITLIDNLRKRGVETKENIKYIGKYIGRSSASDMLRATMYDISKEKICCYLPFLSILVDAFGDVNLCNCVPIIVGNIIDADISDVWNSVTATIGRLSMVNQTYTFCNKDICELDSIGNVKPLHSLSELDYSQQKKNTCSIQTNASNTCNLYCKSCRNCIVVDTGIQKEVSMKLAEKMIPYLKKADYLIMAGYGDIFASESYSYMLDNIEEFYHENFTLVLLSNGILMTKKKIDKIINVCNGNVVVAISVDAAEKETYERLRRGGSWEKLMENLKYVGECAKHGKIKEFALHFVVQSENISEMEKFIELGKKLYATNIYFSIIRNWGTYRENEWEQVSIRDKDGNIKKEYRKYLKDTIFNSDYVEYDKKFRYME